MLKMNNNNHNHKNKKPYLTTGGIAKILHVTRVTVYNWIKLGQLKAARVHQGKYRVSQKDFAQFVKQHKLENSIAPEILAAPTVKILVVDDEPEMVKIIKTFLGKANPHYHLLGATSGFEAGHLIGSFRPNLVILDLVMPGVDGFHICRRIKSDPHTRNTRIIAITAHSSAENLKKIRKEGADAVLTKPFDYRKLLSGVKKLTKS
jgi:excisionase family DNA binding protein